MLQPEAISRFVDKQKLLLRRTYDAAWHHGVHSYTPDPDPSQEPTLPRQMAITGLTGAALLAVVRRYKYVAPTAPDAAARAIALAPAYQGLNSMQGELLMPDPNFDPATWAETNAWRLNAGDSVAWAGEQAGFAAAANADGQMLFAWTSVGDTRVCADCELLSGFPPMALGDWPTSPGAGDTACSVGCRCSWDIWPVQMPDSYTPNLSETQQALGARLADQQLQALSDMMAEAAYLD